MATARNGIRARKLSALPDARAQELFPAGERCRSIFNPHWGLTMRSIILWLVGIPIPIIILLWFFMK